MQFRRRGTAADEALVLLLAGGRGERLYPLTRDRTKGAVPFGGQYRLIDFTLSNCVNSGFCRIFVLPQYKSASLERHLRQGWDFLRPERGEYLETLSPQQRVGDNWYRGTADAVYQNIYTLRQLGLPYTLVLSSDHLYRMDYSGLLDFHMQSGASLTVSCTEAALDEARRLGVVQAEEGGRIRGFAEKPARPAPTLHDPGRALVSMGIYLFDTPALIDMLEEAVRRPGYGHDFGRDIIPQAVAGGGDVYAYDVPRRTGEDGFYWRDIGVLDAYWEASMELLATAPPFDLGQPGWPFYGRRPLPAPCRVVEAQGQGPCLENVLLSPGVRVEGASVRRSLLSPGVQVGPGACVEDSVLMDGVVVGAGAQVRKAVIDKHVEVPAGFRLAADAVVNGQSLAVTAGGVVVVGKGDLLEPPRRASADLEALETALRRAQSQAGGLVLR